ncbi:TolB protein [Flavobacteriaceae bacterium MAR_2010_105]|nr:TolB protein [Flavobacteriaceae bacterium MAR_2010_105]
MSSVKQSYLIIIMLFSFNGIVLGQGFKEEQLTNAAFDNRYASYNYEGKTIIFESNRSGRWQIYSMDINGNNQTRVVSSTGNDRRPSWHPYKNMIIFESDRSGINNLYTYDFDTKQLEKVPVPLNGNKSYAQFAPNGKEIVFNYKVSDNNFNIHKVGLNGKRLRTYVNNAYQNMYPRFSPVGDAILYFSRKQTKREADEIYVLNIYAKKENRLTNSPLHQTYASYSNSGTQIVYVSAMENTEPEIYMMTKEGKSQRRITFNNHPDTLPNWSPQDFNLLVTRTINGHDQIIKILLKEEL